MDFVEVTVSAHMHSRLPIQVLNNNSDYSQFYCPAKVQIVGN